MTLIEQAPYAFAATAFLSAFIGYAFSKKLYLARVDLAEARVVYFKDRIEGMTRDETPNAAGARPRSDRTDWANRAAERLITDFKDAAAIDTSNYALCGFILAAAELALNDADVSRKIGGLMEPPRRETEVS